MATLSPEFSIARQRWSAPCQPQRHTTLQAEPPKHPQTKHESITSFQFGTAKYSELTAATIVEFEGDDLSTVSNVEPRNGQLGEWRPSFIRVGPLLGLAVGEGDSLNSRFLLA
jgi:hypothetical protein